MLNARLLKSASADGGQEVKHLNLEWIRPFVALRVTIFNFELLILNLLL